MTKKLSKEEKKKRKEERQAKAQQMQKAPSKTVQNVQVPKAEGADQTPEPEVNLCDTCAYEFGECGGKPVFGEEEGSDRVVKCPAWVDIEGFPTADQSNKAAAGPGAAAEEMKKADIDYPDIVIVCAGGCGKTTEGMTMETRSGEFKEVDESGVPEWTCQECVENREPPEPEPEPVSKKEMAILEGLPARPDPKRFQEDKTDYGACPACERSLKRTAYNRYRDAIRCTNPRCGQYREVVKTISTGVK